MFQSRKIYMEECRGIIMLPIYSFPSLNILKISLHSKIKPNETWLKSNQLLLIRYYLKDLKLFDSLKSMI